MRGIVEELEKTPVPGAQRLLGNPCQGRTAAAVDALPRHPAAEAPEGPAPTPSTPYTKPRPRGGPLWPSLGAGA
ncbi:hypothetical protein PABY_11040 [Pyrodictium abyssi]|uniref:Uncharacterized protein n=2 Tax=Pyrodictium abyssi TaxID=54256 RepID=A0ABN6ZMS0_9CREN|nr:hypothetical protein PABY_11040 [Pyrodictium abyssi]